MYFEHKNGIYEITKETPFNFYRTMDKKEIIFSISLKNKEHKFVFNNHNMEFQNFIQQFYNLGLNIFLYNQKNVLIGFHLSVNLKINIISTNNHFTEVFYANTILIIPCTQIEIEQQIKLIQNIKNF